MLDSRCGCSLKSFYFVHHLSFGIVVFEGVKDGVVSIVSVQPADPSPFLQFQFFFYKLMGPFPQLIVHVINVLIGSQIWFYFWDNE